MRWGDGRRSDNVEDRRGMSGPGRLLGGGMGTVVLVIVALYFGVDPSILLNQGGLPLPGSPDSAPYQASTEERHLADFVSVVLADTEDTWHATLPQHGQGVRGAQARALFRSPSNPPAAWPRRPSGRSTARRTGSSTST